MPAYNPDQFARQLLIEALFYDAEYGSLGNVSLIDTEANRERFLASFDPERDTYLIEEATKWEDLDVDDDGEVEYALAVEGREHATFETPSEAADVLLHLAEEYGLAPSFMVLFEEEPG